MTEELVCARAWHMEGLKHKVAGDTASRKGRWRPGAVCRGKSWTPLCLCPFLSTEDNPNTSVAHRLL